MRQRYALVGLVAAAFAAIAAGCGGGGGHSSGTSGGIDVGVYFPTQSAIVPAKIPGHAESVRISVFAASSHDSTGAADIAADTPAGASGRRLVPDTILNRPPGGGVAQASIPGIPEGPAIVRASAHGQPDGQGPALAEAQKPVTIVAGQMTDLALTLAEVVARIAASPGSLRMLVGELAQIVAEAQDATGAVIIGACLEVSSDDPSVATVDATGRVQALSLGATDLRARHTPSGVEAIVPVRVVRARVVRVEVSADRPATVPGSPVQFSAAAFDDLGRPRTAVQFDWRVEDATMGSIDATGRFAPAQVGVGKVIARERVSGTEGVGQVDVAEWAVVLEWATDGDLDLHLFDGANHAYFGNPVIPIGRLVSDEIGPPGAEAFGGSTAKAGRFPVAVNYFRGQGDVPGTATLLVPAKGPFAEAFTLTRSNANGGYPVTAPTASWARPFDVVVSASGDVSAASADTSVPLQPAAVRSK